MNRDFKGYKLNFLKKGGKAFQGIFNADEGPPPAYAGLNNSKKNVEKEKDNIDPEKPNQEGGKFASMEDKGTHSLNRLDLAKEINKTYKERSIQPYYVRRTPSVPTHAKSCMYEHRFSDSTYSTMLTYEQIQALRGSSSMEAKKETKILCSPCKRSKEEVHAVLWCNNCNEGLCHECSNHHTRSRASAHHKVLPLSDVQSELQLLDKLQINTLCELHPDHPIEVYCEDEDVFCCTVCISTDHRRCNNVQSIDQIVKTYTTNMKENDIQDIYTLIASADEIIEKRKVAIKEANIRSTENLKNVKVRFDKVITILQRKRDSVEKEIEEAEKKVTQFNNNCIDVYQKLKEKVNDNLQILNAHERLSHAQSLMARQKTLNAIRKQTEETLKTVSSSIPEIKTSHSYKINISDISFCDIFIEEKKADMSVFSTHCNLITDRLYRHLSTMGTAQVARELVPLKPPDISFVASAERSKIQSGIDIYDGTHLPDNTILLCDYDNKQLIKLDENLGFIQKLLVTGKPSGVCVSSNNTNVHVVCDHNKVVSYTFQGPWREVNRFDTEGRAEGIACHGDRMVTAHGSYIVIYASTGTEVGRVNTSGGSKYPAHSNDGMMLYYADYDDGVVCRHIEDVTYKVWGFSTDKIMSAHGIDTDRDDNLLIVERESQNILKVSRVGELNGVLVDNMKYIKWPYGLFYNRNNNTFCVTSSSKYDNVCIEMYRLQDSSKGALSRRIRRKENRTNLLTFNSFNWDSLKTRHRDEYLRDRIPKD